jgi:hypothetical protein
LLDHESLVRQVRHNPLDNKECGEAKDRKPPGLGYDYVIPIWQSFILGNIEKDLHETSEQRRTEMPQVSFTDIAAGGPLTVYDHCSAVASVLSVEQTARADNPIPEIYLRNISR